MGMINRIATPTNRSGLLSTYLVIGYIGSMLPMMAIGWIADHWGMNAAVSQLLQLCRDFGDHGGGAVFQASPHAHCCALSLSGRAPRRRVCSQHRPRWGAQMAGSC